MVIGQDEKVRKSNFSVVRTDFIHCKDVGTENDWYEEQRPVEEILVHPDCNPGK